MRTRCVRMGRMGLAALAISCGGAGPGLPSAHAVDQRAMAEVTKSFALLKQAIARKDRDRIVAQLSPETMTMFGECRKLALNPDPTNLVSLSQIEVLLGLQAHWLIERRDLQAMSPADLFAWGAQKSVVPIETFATVDLYDIQVKGARATAYMKSGATVMTNAVVPFILRDGRWRMDLRGFLLAAEPQLEEVRAREHMSKAEMAIAMLEQMYKQPIPALRELLLSPRVRQLIGRLQNAEPVRIYDSVIAELSAGRQGDAEDLLEVFVSTHTNDQRLAFAQAVCTRSRFSTAKADWQFSRVLDMNPRTVEGKCARYMLDLDDRKEVDRGFNGLRLLCEENPKNPLLHWMVGVQCRDDYSHTKKKDRAEEGAAAYKRVLEIFDVGPVLVHQTYANILSIELHRNEEALVHRRLAVQLEPRTWTYEGLASTLSAMEKFEESNATYAKLVEMDPSRAEYWHNWAGSLTYQAKWDECIAKCRKALEADPGYFKAPCTWGDALKAQGKLKEAVWQYEEAIRMNPAYPYPYGAAAQVLHQLGEHRRAMEFTAKKERLTGNATGGQSGSGAEGVARPALTSPE